MGTIGHKLWSAIRTKLTPGEWFLKRNGHIIGYAVIVARGELWIDPDTDPEDPAGYTPTTIRVMDRQNKVVAEKQLLKEGWQQFIFDVADGIPDAMFQPEAEGMMLTMYRHRLAREKFQVIHMRHLLRQEIRDRRAGSPEAMDDKAFRRWWDCYRTHMRAVQLTEQRVLRQERADAAALGSLIATNAMMDAAFGGRPSA